MKYRHLLLCLLFGLLVQFPPAAVIVVPFLAQPAVAGLLGGLFLHHHRHNRAGGTR
ncbi:hypothetical protein [Streptantibioticus silvisoli]|uniref:Uncharacterized protein n=1 Tax=Streptantibioticus silvisoli TaxID=2705255 RepID=A0ABT6W353_9ACTN|nr:hypothetical protein [Streptantibioticus silvisoli]MDI5964840.1 hypothetical protein [Streptantibioticus silvisoli]